MEIATKKDITNIEKILISQSEILKKLAGSKPKRIIRNGEIMERLSITKQQTFYKRLPELIKAGAFKDGGWCIMEDDLDKYMESLKTSNTIKI